EDPAERAERGEAGLLGHLTTRRGLEPRIARLEVAAGLEPAPELLVEDQREPRPRGIHDEGAHRHVAGHVVITGQTGFTLGDELDQCLVMTEFPCIRWPMC